MKIDDVIREGLRELADDIPASAGLAKTAVRRARRRRAGARVTVAASVVAAAAVAVPVGVGVVSQPDGATTGVLGPAAPPPAEFDPEILPAPSSRQVGQDELVEAFADCRVDADGEQVQGYEGWEPVFGVELEVDAPEGTPTTWIAARRGDAYRADCALDTSGNVVAGGGEYGLKSTPALLFALVDGQEGLGVGRYVDPVAQVTVQYEDGPEQEVVRHDGFWFYPSDGQDGQLDEPSSPADQERSAEGASSDFVGVPAGYTYRGYDADGNLVHDSTVDGPFIDDCYADPTGSEFVGNYSGRSDPADCIRTHQWRPGS